MKILPAFAALVLLPAGYATVSVDVALKPEGPWKPYATRTLDDLPAVANAQPDAGLTRYGGLLARQEKATGFFHATKRGARWHWFKYADNDPDNQKTDPSNRDSNKGIVTNRYESYPGLIASMQRINQRAYQLAEYFAAQK